MDLVQNFRDYYNEETKIISMPESGVEIPKEGLGYALFHSMKEHFGKTALIEIHTHEICTYDDLFLKAVRTAIKIKSMGIKPGDVISICSYTQIDAVTTFLSAFLCGAVNASLEPCLSDRDLEYLIEQAEPKMFFVSTDCEKRVEEIKTKLNMDSKIVVYGETDKNIRYSEFDCPQADEDTFEPYIVEDIEEMCLILFSSGSSGLPKAMYFSHKYLCYHSVCVISEIKNAFTLARIYWTGTIQLILMQIRSGNQFSILTKFDPREIWDGVEKYKPTLLQMPPYIATELIRNKPKDREVDLKYFAIVGCSISKENMLKMREALPNTIINGAYAMSETAQLLFPLHQKSYMKVNSAGIPMAGIQYKVVDPETEQNVGFNQKGELRVKSPYQLKGYYKRDSSECWDEEGYFKTGDVVYFDEDFSFFIVDRIKEMFKCKGNQIVPVKYESILEDHPDIDIAVIVGIPHAVYGNEIMAVVVPRKGADITPEIVLEYFNSTVSEREKITAGVKFMESIPLTPSGKVARNKLKQMMNNKM